MATSKTDKHAEYSRYAAYCLAVLPAVADRHDQAVQRAMAAEWLRLAQDIRRRSRPTQMQME
jgi:hypothetical protein